MEYKVLVNESNVRTVKPTGGLCQGDLFSLIYLFYLELFSYLLAKANDLKGIKVCREAPAITLVRG